MKDFIHGTLAHKHDHRKLMGSRFMTKILLTGVAALAMVTSAHADPLPRSVLGKWCVNASESTGLKWVDYLFKWDEDCSAEDVIQIKHNEWTGWEFSCKFIAAKTRFDPTIPRDTKNSGVWVSHIEAKCFGLCTTWRSNFILYFSKGQLEMRGRNGKERPDHAC
jgi:hypothetical protein